MEGFSNKKYNIKNYANHLNSHKHNSHKEFLSNHNIDKREVWQLMENFYSLYFDFYVNESDFVSSALNIDYKNYEKWLLDD